MIHLALRCGDVASQVAYSRRSKRWTLPRPWYTRYVKIPGAGGSGGGVQLIFVDWVALEGAHTRGKGDRRFEDQLSAAAGPAAAAAQWEWLRRVTTRGSARQILLASSSNAL